MAGRVFRLWRVSRPSTTRTARFRLLPRDRVSDTLNDTALLLNMPKEKSAGGAYYAVARGRSPGVYTTWCAIFQHQPRADYTHFLRRDKCLKQTSGFPGSKYKKFYTLGEAKEWVKRPDAATTSTPKEVTKMIRSTVDESGWQVVYSDGACKGNGAPGSVAGIGVWWGSDDPRWVTSAPQSIVANKPMRFRNIAERCPGSQTNNRAELIVGLRNSFFFVIFQLKRIQALIRALEATKGIKSLKIKSDSKYSINCGFCSVLYDGRLVLYTNAM